MPDGSGKGRSRQGKHRDPRPSNDIPTANENLLYLLAELELAVERPTLDWSADLAARVQRRLEDLIFQIGRRGG